MTIVFSSGKQRAVLVGTHRYFGRITAILSALSIGLPSPLYARTRRASPQPDLPRCLVEEKTYASQADFDRCFRDVTGEFMPEGDGPFYLARFPQPRDLNNLRQKLLTELAPQLAKMGSWPGSGGTKDDYQTLMDPRTATQAMKNFDIKMLGKNLEITYDSLTPQIGKITKYDVSHADHTAITREEAKELLSKLPPDAIKNWKGSVHGQLIVQGLQALTTALNPKEAKRKRLEHLRDVIAANIEFSENWANEEDLREQKRSLAVVNKALSGDVTDIDWKEIRIRNNNIQQSYDAEIRNAEMAYAFAEGVHAASVGAIAVYATVTTGGMAAGVLAGTTLGAVGNVMRGIEEFGDLRHPIGQVARDVALNTLNDAGTAALAAVGTSVATKVLARQASGAISLAERVRFGLLGGTEVGAKTLPIVIAQDIAHHETPSQIVASSLVHVGVSAATFGTSSGLTTIREGLESAVKRFLVRITDVAAATGYGLLGAGIQSGGHFSDNLVQQVPNLLVNEVAGNRVSAPKESLKTKLISTEYRDFSSWSKPYLKSAKEFFQSKLNPTVQVPELTKSVTTTEASVDAPPQPAPLEEVQPISPAPELAEAPSQPTADIVLATSHSPESNIKLNALIERTTVAANFHGIKAHEKVLYENLTGALSMKSPINPPKPGASPRQMRKYLEHSAEFHAERAKRIEAAIKELNKIKSYQVTVASLRKTHESIIGETTGQALPYARQAAEDAQKAVADFTTRSVPKEEIVEEQPPAVPAPKAISDEEFHSQFRRLKNVANSRLGHQRKFEYQLAHLRAIDPAELNTPEMVAQHQARLDALEKEKIPIARASAEEAKAAAERFFMEVKGDRVRQLEGRIAEHREAISQARQKLDALNAVNRPNLPTAELRKHIANVSEAKDALARAERNLRADQSTLDLLLQPLQLKTLKVEPANALTTPFDFEMHQRKIRELERERDIKNKEIDRLAVHDPRKENLKKELSEIQAKLRDARRVHREEREKQTSGGSDESDPEASLAPENPPTRPPRLRTFSGKPLGERLGFGPHGTEIYRDGSNKSLAVILFPEMDHAAKTVQFRRDYESLRKDINGHTPISLPLNGFGTSGKSIRFPAQLLDQTPVVYYRKGFGWVGEAPKSLAEIHTSILERIVDLESMDGQSIGFVKKEGGYIPVPGRQGIHEPPAQTSHYVTGAAEGATDVIKSEGLTAFAAKSNGTNKAASGTVAIVDKPEVVASITTSPDTTSRTSARAAEIVAASIHRELKNNKVLKTNVRTLLRRGIDRGIVEMKAAGIPPSVNVSAGASLRFPDGKFLTAKVGPLDFYRVDSRRLSMDAVKSIGKNSRNPKVAARRASTHPKTKSTMTTTWGRLNSGDRIVQISRTRTKGPTPESRDLLDHVVNIRRMANAASPTELHQTISHKDNGAVTAGVISHFGNDLN